MSLSTGRDPLVEPKRCCGRCLCLDHGTRRRSQSCYGNTHAIRISVPQAKKTIAGSFQKAPNHHPTGPPTTRKMAPARNLSMSRALPRTTTVYNSIRSGQAIRDTNIPTIPIPPLIIAGSWRYIPADQPPRLKASTTRDTKNMLSITWPPRDEVDAAEQPPPGGPGR